MQYPFLFLHNAILQFPNNFHLYLALLFHLYTSLSPSAAIPAPVNGLHGKLIACTGEAKFIATFIFLISSANQPLTN